MKKLSSEIMPENSSRECVRNLDLWVQTISMSGYPWGILEDKKHKSIKLHKKRSNFFEGFDFLSYPFNLVRRESFIGKMSKKNK